jgi:hypothetical protein
MKTSFVKVLFVVFAALAMAGCLNPIGFMSNAGLGLGGGGINTGNGISDAGQGATGETNPGIITNKDLALLYTHNLSKTAAITRIVYTLSSPPESFTKGPISVLSTYSTTHTPSIDVVWSIEVTYRDPTAIAPTPTEGTLTITKPLLKLGQINFINHLWFYKGTDGLFHLDPSDDATGDPPPDLDNLDQDPTKRDKAVIRIFNKSKSTSIVAHITPYELPEIPPALNIIAISNGSKSVPSTNSQYKYSIRIDWESTNTPATGTVSIHDIMTRPTAERNFYFYRTIYGEFVITDDPNGDIDLDDTRPDNGGGGDNGEGENPDDTTYDPTKLGIVIVRNLTSGSANGRNVNSVSFQRIGKGPFTMTPGPTQGSEKAILLSPGTWTVDLYFTPEDDDEPDDGHIQTHKVVVAAAGHSNYIYFYKRASGPFDIETGNSIPSADFDPSNTTTTIADGTGIFHIVNNSAVGSIIAQVRWHDVNYPVTIAQGNSRDLQVEAGTGNLSFRISNKSTFGIELAYTLHNRETIDVTYMDSFENTAALPPPGSSSIMIDNRSTFTVNKFVIYKINLDTVTVENTAFEPPGPIGPNGRSSKIVENANDVVIQLYMSSGTENMVLSRAARLDNTVVLITINPNDTEDGTGKGTEDEDSTGLNVGGLRVFNNYYAGVPNGPDMKIFKFKLYAKDDDGNYPLYPLSPDYTWNGTGDGPSWVGSIIPDSATEYAPILRSSNENIYNLAQGYYKLVIVASVYPWTTVAAGNYTPPGMNTFLTETSISYDCGDILITDNIERQYYFNVAAGKEKDVPRGFVEIMISYTGISAGDLDTISYHPASFVEIAVPKTNVTELGNGNGVYSRLFSYWPGTWAGLQDGPYVGPDHLVLKHQGIIGYAQTVGPYYIPPGFYYGRYGDSYSSGRVFGNGNLGYWRVMDLSKKGGHRVYIQLDPTVGLAWN